MAAAPVGQAAPVPYPGDFESLRVDTIEGGDGAILQQKFWHPLFITALGEVLIKYFRNELEVTNKIMSDFVEFHLNHHTLYDPNGAVGVPGGRISLSGHGESSKPEVGMLRVESVYEKAVCFDFCDETDDVDTPENASALVSDLGRYFCLRGWTLLLERQTGSEIKPLWVQASDSTFDRAIIPPSKDYYRPFTKLDRGRQLLPIARYYIDGMSQQCFEMSAIELISPDPPVTSDGVRLVITRCPRKWLPADYNPVFHPRRGALPLQPGGPGGDDPVGVHMGRPNDLCTLMPGATSTDRVAAPPI